MHQLSPAAAKALREFASAEDGWIYPASDGEIQLFCAALPGRAAVAAIRDGAVLTIIVDTDKPAAREHLRQLIDGWPLGPASTHSLDDPVAPFVPFPPRGVADGAPVLVRETSGDVGLG